MPAALLSSPQRPLPSCVRASVAVLLGLSVALSSARAGFGHALAATNQAPPHLCDGLSPIEILFRFGTGAPTAAPPAVGPDGNVYVGTTDGYVHALSSDGAYRWSYTLAGPVVGRAAVGESGTLLVPTLRRIYAIRPDGTLLWVFTSPVPVLSDLVRDGVGRFHFTSDGGRLFALSGRGALVAHVPGPSAFSTRPVALADGAIAVGRKDGRVLVSRPGKNQHFALGEAASSVLACASASGLCAVAGGVLRTLGSTSNGFQTRATRVASNANLLLVLWADTELELFRGPAGERLFSMVLPEPASASPVIDPRGRVFVGLRSGSLLSISKDGSVIGCTSVGQSPLGTPVLDSVRGRVLVTLSEGALVALGTGP